MAGSTANTLQSGTFRISPTAEVADELRRVGREEIDRAITAARGIPEDPSRSVHECRKSIKRLRALAQLGRGRKASEWQLVDRGLRNTGRLLAAARDADVVMRTVAELMGEHELTGDPQRLFDPGPPIAASEALAEAVIVRLETARAGLDELFVDDDWGIRHLLRGVDKGLRKTFRSLQRFRRRGKASDAHEWRKGVQRYANQLKLLDGFPVSAPVEAGRSGESGESGDQAGRLDELAACLGTYHDLTVMRSAIRSSHPPVGKNETKSLLHSARQRQRALRQRALELGARLFGDE